MGKLRIFFEREGKTNARDLTDPFESYDTTDSYGHLLQKVSWMVGPLGALMKEHLSTLAEYPPVQGGKSALQRPVPARA